MRIGVTPTKSPAHKLTCLTLYRTLLRQSLHLPPHLSKPLLNLIGQRFHLDRKCTSKPTIVSALSTARSALTLITSAAKGDTASTNTLTTLLTQIEARAQETHTTLLHQHSLRGPTATSKFRKIAHLKKTSTKLWKARIPDSPPILSRPVLKKDLPNPEKPRRVPHLTSTQGIPFLRYKSGPQSPALSYALRSMYGQTIRRWDLFDRLIEDVGHGALEDNWDSLVHAFTGIRDEEGAYADERRGPATRTRGGEAIVEFNGLRGNKSWTVEAKDALDVLKGDIANVTAARTKTARQMRDIVVRERALAEKEKAERKEAARADWVATQIAEGNIVPEMIKGTSSAAGTTVKSTDHHRGTSSGNIRDERSRPSSNVRIERGIGKPRRPGQSTWSPRR